MELDGLVEDWPVDTVAAGVTDARDTLATVGDLEWVVRIASISKTMVGVAAMVAVEEESIGLDDPAGPPGSTVRHLLAHASGLGFDDDRLIADPGTRRVYSNTGVEVLAAYLEEKTGISIADYLRDAIFEPLGMTRTELRGSPAHGVHSCVDDLLVFGRELLAPILIAPHTLTDATSPQFEELGGVIPGLGTFRPNPWGLGFEIRAHKDPHWTGTANSPETFGHFGGSGTFLWVDPEVGLACVALTDRDFGPWALEVWPSFSDDVLGRHAARQ